MIYIRKNGIFYENGYNPDAEEYIMTRVESIVPYLNETIHIDREITLEDLFDIVEEDEEIINIIFGSHLGHHPLRPFFDEIKRDCMMESQEDLDLIEFSWLVEQFDYKKFYEKYKDKREQTEDIFGALKKPDGDELNEISIYVDIHGWGPVESKEDEEYVAKDEPMDYTTYGIEFTPLYRMKHLPIRLNKEFLIRNDKYNDEREIIVQGVKEFTVFEVFGTLFSEITFLGLPEERDEQWKSVTDSVEEYKEKMDEEDDDDDEEKEEEQLQ
jgi:hypothetical protein